MANIKKACQTGKSLAALSRAATHKTVIRSPVTLRPKVHSPISLEPHSRVAFRSFATSMTEVGESYESGLDAFPVGLRSALPTEQPEVHAVFERQTATWQYIVVDKATSRAVVIDPVLDFDSASMTISTASADQLLSTLADRGYVVTMILETHVHADHITAASYLRNRLAKTQQFTPTIGIGKRILQVQEYFGRRYQIPATRYSNAFDKLFEDDECFSVGNLECKVLHLPGHTPDHVGYKIGDNVFAGDSIFNVDVGSARADFPGGSARSLFASKNKILALPAHTKLWVGHDYPPNGERDPLPCSSVAEHRKENKHFKDGTSEDSYVKMRQDRDQVLSEPRLMHFAVQMNISAGRLPEPNAAGVRLMHIPLKHGGMKF